MSINNEPTEFIELTMSELYLIASALSNLAAEKADLAESCLSQGKLRQAKSHNHISRKAADLGERMLSKVQGGNDL